MLQSYRCIMPLFCNAKQDAAALSDSPPPTMKIADKDVSEDADRGIRAWALRAATRTAAAVSEGGNCKMGSSASAWVARAKAQPAASLTVSPLLRSTFRRCK